MIYTLVFSLCFSSPHSQVGYRHISSITIALRGEEGYGRSRGWWGAATELWRRGDYGALRIVSPLPTKWLPRAASGQSWSLFFFHLFGSSVTMTFPKYDYHMPGVNVILLMHLAINTIGDRSKEPNVMSASQVIKGKHRRIQSQEVTFSVGNIYLARYDSGWRWIKGLLTYLPFTLISFHPPIYG